MFDVFPQDQELANYGPRAEFGSPPIFISTVLFGDGHIHSFTYCLGRVGATLAELSNCDRKLMA